MPLRRSRKTTAIFLGWLLVTLFLCQGMVYPVNGELGMITFEIADIQFLDEDKDAVKDEAEKDHVIESSQEESNVQASNAQISNTQISNTNTQKVNDQNMDTNTSTSPSYELDLKGGAQLVTIQMGETLSEVAHRYQTTTAELVRLNKIAKPNYVQAGQKIWVPASGVIIYSATADPSRGRAFVTQEELDLLARVIHAEARGEDFEGQVAVGAVVLNRVEDDRFPDTIHDVVYQPGAFTAVIDKQIHLTPNQSAYRAAEVALMGEDPTQGAIYYYNPRTATDRWIKTRPVVRTIGNHTFGI
ncbi:putative cell wall hydrolase [Desulfitobacterium dichloroeliminans LMG P-21439]|uniref:Putative cell wall hydrolase n=1 Tax=Desulfitobacterium dichloroeliminans (strain LMG P-21439 / DCA1) TaxID=871963 RepID=L0FBG1_DESDL|nr:cell wall hydrolase [Desulfitobacterium dichloroeliminans]AGA70537.1 putative cell wall hydrolase [Desulfitobacterium dichloroeliminans LMG P-21439]